MSKFTMLHLLIIGVITSLFCFFLFHVISYLRCHLLHNRKEGGFELAKPQKTDMEEKRQDPRLELKWPVTMETSEGSINVETKNINLSGAFVVYQNPMPVGKIFCITLDIPNLKPLSLNSEVVWNNMNVPDDKIVTRGMGVRFLPISDKDRQFLNNALSTHKNQKKQKKESIL